MIAEDDNTYSITDQNGYRMKSMQQFATEEMTSNDEFAEDYKE